MFNYEELSEEDKKRMQAENMEEIQRIARLFDNEQFPMSQLYQNNLVTMAAQVNSLSLLLIELGIIDKEDFNLRYSELLKERMQEHEKEHLPQIKKARIQAQLQQDAQMIQEMPHIFGPNGKPMDGSGN